MQMVRCAFNASLTSPVKQWELFIYSHDVSLITFFPLNGMVCVAKAAVMNETLTQDVMNI